MKITALQAAIRLRRTSTDALIDYLAGGGSDMQDDRSSIGRELRARMGGLRLLSDQEAAAIESMVNGSAAASDIELIRHALGDVRYGDSGEHEIEADDSPSGAKPELAPEYRETRQTAAMPGLVIAAGGIRAAAHPQRGNYRYVPTIDLVRHFRQDRARLSYIELDLMLDELSTRARYFKGEMAAEQLKWLGQLRWGLLSEEDTVRLTAIIPRTAVEIVQGFAAGTPKISPESLFASMELIARGAYGGWFTGQSLANCKALIRKLLLTQARSGTSPVSDKMRSAINAFVDASGPGKSALDEWCTVAAMF